MLDYAKLPIGEHAPKLVTAVIEIPLGSVNKYEYDKKLHVFRLDRTLHSPVHYPGDYGFIPGTLASDGDPLDVLVLVDAASFPGCVMEVRPIGLLRMVDQGQKDSKVLAVTSSDPTYAEVKNFEGVYTHILKEIEHFFTIYKSLEGKRVQTMGWETAGEAHKVIENCRKRFEEKRGAQDQR